MTRNRLYLLLGLGVTAGYGWVLWSSQKTHSNFTPCLFKNATGIACPSCGSTRAVVLLANGQFKDALLINPLSVIMAAIMLITPFWLLYDIALKKNTLYNSYQKAESIIRTKPIAITLIVLLLINWLWNIQKEL